MGTPQARVFLFNFARKKHAACQQKSGVFFKRANPPVF